MKSLGAAVATGIQEGFVMRKSLLAVAVFALVSCSSARSDSGLGAAKVDILKPDVEIAQLSSIPHAARHVMGGIPIHYAVRVGNRSAETITLKHVVVQSVGVGAYDVATSSHPFSKAIQPDQFEIVELWVAASVSTSTIIGANGPVTLRATLHFDSPVGQFQEIVIRQVNAMPGRGNSAQE
ncbi:MAG TPA: hypothetical protein VM779_15285 [Thermoanaerobaculia bacterium]|nr:hypothetical protein [Thermoanaerobaculia bacterium]